MTSADKSSLVVHATGCCCFPRLARKATEAVSERQFQDPTIGIENNRPLSQAHPLNTFHDLSRKESVATVYDLPPGWRAVTSRSRPDRTAFLNEFTGERISWVPSDPASTVKGEIRKSKRRSKVNNERSSVHSSESENTRTSIDRRGPESSIG